jgi:hypothetical protein
VANRTHNSKGEGGGQGQRGRGGGKKQRTANNYNTLMSSVQALASPRRQGGGRGEKRPLGQGHQWENRKRLEEWPQGWKVHSEGSKEVAPGGGAEQSTRLPPLGHEDSQVVHH